MPGAPVLSLDADEVPGLEHKTATKHLQIEEICSGARVLAAGHGRYAVWLDLANDIQEAG